MTDYPIIFSKPMIHALRAGRKTQTRRLAWRDAGFGLQDYASEQLEDMELRGWDVVGEGDEGLFRVYKPTPWQKVKPGDRLWVRENFAPRYFDDGRPAYGTDWTGDSADMVPRPKWTPCIHMPRSASRLTLLVTGTKIEPLMDISEDDAKAEGFTGGPIGGAFGPQDIGNGWTIESPGGYASAAGMFQILWTKLHPEWDGYSSPDVVAVSFSVIEQNIDAMPLAA